nr:MAG TPA_asm: hypothetical protein [Caudoviricetes sp.]
MIFIGDRQDGWSYNLTAPCLKKRPIAYLLCLILRFIRGDSGYELLIQKKANQTLNKNPVIRQLLR